MKRIYLDYAATTPTDPRVVDEMLPYFTENFGNPSSVHSFGQEARGAIEKARADIAGLIGAAPDEIVFVSGGTEANNTALKGIARAKRDKGDHIITSSVEHHSVSETAAALKKEGFRVTTLPVDEYGMVDPDDVKKAIGEKTILISIMHANNEIGTIQPIVELAAIAHERNCLFHCDAVQTVGQLPVDVRTLGVDLLTFSAHKFYGPKGVGGLYVRAGVNLTPLIHGGFQEAKRRAGTENVAGIAGAAKAFELAQQHLSDEAVRLTHLRDSLWEQIGRRIADVRLNGHPTRRLPNNVNVSFKGVEAEGLLLKLSQAGIAASMGSACTSESIEPSHVIQALGLPADWERGVLRFTLGCQTTAEDIDYTVEVLARSVPAVRA